MVKKPGRDALRMIGAAALAGMTLLTARAEEKFIVVASTTSTQDSGLFGHVLPLFKARTGIDVRVVAQGTGQALATARKGDADVVFVHDKVAEQKFVEDGFGIGRREVMYNDFIMVGPKSDPAGAAGRDVIDALKKIEAARVPFASRGDNSGTHTAELRYWKAADIDPPHRQGWLVSRDRRGDGPHLEYGQCDECLCHCGSRHLAVIQESRRTRDTR